MSNGLQQLLNLVIGIFLARQLSQTDYGMVGMITIFTALGTCLQEGGFISAINKRKNATQEDYNAVFWTSLGIGLTCYAILFACSPLIAKFFKQPELTWLTRYVALGLCYSTFCTTGAESRLVGYGRAVEHARHFEVGLLGKFAS